MKLDEESVSCVLFRLCHSSNIFAIQLQYVTWIEALAGKVVSIPQSPDHAVGVCQLHGKSISIIDLGQLLGLRQEPDSSISKQCLMLLANTQTGFLVETILGVEMLQSPRNAEVFSKGPIHSVYSCGSREKMVLELDVPYLLSLRGCSIELQ